MNFFLFLQPSKPTPLLAVKLPLHSTSKVDFYRDTFDIWILEGIIS